MKILVLGFGNRGRNDDGAGWFVIEQLQEKKLAGVELETSHQLEVDMAETITHYDYVIFVDAAMPKGLPVTSRSVVKPRLQSHAVAHYLTPSDLLAMSSSLYGSEPGGMLFSVPGQDFNFGTELTESTKRAALGVVREITELIALLRDRNPGSTPRKATHA